MADKHPWLREKNKLKIKLNIHTKAVKASFYGDFRGEIQGFYAEE